MAGFKCILTAIRIHTVHICVDRERVLHILNILVHLIVSKIFPKKVETFELNPWLTFSRWSTMTMDVNRLPLSPTLCFGPGEAQVQIGGRWGWDVKQDGCLLICFFISQDRSFSLYIYIHITRQYNGEHESSKSWNWKKLMLSASFSVCHGASM